MCEEDIELARRVLRGAATACSPEQLAAVAAVLATIGRGGRAAAAASLGISVPALDARLKRARPKIRAAIDAETGSTS